MAALEKIRSKAVFLTVIIGVALLAFILGDFLTSGRTFFGDGNTIAKVGDEKIDAIVFQRRYEKMSAQLQERGQSVDGAVIQNQVLNQMMSEILLDQEIEALGIYVTDEELTAAMTGKNARPQIMQFARQMGAETPDQLHDMLFNPAKYGIPEEQVLKAREAWIDMEKDMERSMKYEKLQTLITGTLQANDLDRKELWEENATINTINYVKQDYATLNDKDYEPTDAEIKKVYDEEQRPQIVIYGKRGHAEVLGLVGQTQGEATVIECVEEAARLDFSRSIALFSQTTKSLEGFRQVVDYITAHIQPPASFRYFDTICRQVANRLPNICAFAARHDVVIFVCGLKSSNGRVLYEACRRVNPRSHLVDNPQALRREWFEQAESVGICGATSTPKWLMESCREAIAGM